MNKKIADINLISQNFIFIGGLTRSGKSFICPIISSFKKTQMFICESVAENIYYLYYLKKISFDYAKFLLRHIYNERV